VTALFCHVALRVYLRLGWIKLFNWICYTLEKDVEADEQRGRSGSLRRATTRFRKHGTGPRISARASTRNALGVQSVAADDYEKQLHSGKHKADRKACNQPSLLHRAKIFAICTRIDGAFAGPQPGYLILSWNSTRVSIEFCAPNGIDPTRSTGVAGVLSWKLALG
jgi:hypothetical protein